VGTFGALLQATSPGSEEAAFYAARLNEFKWTLSVSSRKAPWISGALELLDATALMLTRLPSKPVSVADDSDGMDRELMMTGFGVGTMRSEMEVDGW
jgi:hypothetical protein